MPVCSLKLATRVVSVFITTVRVAEVLPSLHFSKTYPQVNRKRSCPHYHHRGELPQATSSRTHPKHFNWTNLKAELLCFLVNSLFLAIAICFCLLLAGCSVTKTFPVETIKKVTKVDTIYLSNIQYDSIYINNVLYTDRSRDTLLIRETNTEFRYKLLRDTVERIKIEVVHDSIPYEVRIETVKEVPRKQTWFDNLCQYTFFLLCGVLLLLLYRTIRKFRLLI